MANTKTNNITKISQLPEMNKIWQGMKTIVALGRSNYTIDLSLIKGRRIVDMYEVTSDKSGGQNVIYIKFDDDVTYPIYVYNGNDGLQGKTGGDGPQGNQGEDAIINYNSKDAEGRGVEGVMYINNTVTSESEDEPWSAYRGKDMYDKIYLLNETFLTEEQYENLFTNIKYIYAEFTTTQDDTLANIFNNDTNPHIVYKKYWTYEDDGSQTYYIFVRNTTLDDGTFVPVYDAITADLWKDIYLGATEGYFPITTSMATDDTDLFFYNQRTDTYDPVEKVELTISGNNIYLGDKHIDPYYIKELDVDLIADYSSNTKQWAFDIKSSARYVPDLYKMEFIEHTVTVENEDGTTSTQTEYETVYKQLTKDEILAIDTSKYEIYYVKNGDEYNEVTNAALERYLATPDVRYYIRNIVEVTNSNGIVTGYAASNNNLYCEVTESQISEENWDDFIIFTHDRIRNQYILERHYPVVEYGENVYHIDTVTLRDVDIYYYTEDRKYYVNKLVTDENGNQSYVYEAIDIPSWIYAEFKSTDEDQLVRLLSANDETTGKTEDNTEIDTTIEDTTAEVEYAKITYIVPGEKKPLYHKDTAGTYTLIDLNKDSLQTTGEYYTRNDVDNYVEITGEAAKAQGIIELYTKNNDSYVLYRGTIVNDATYYQRKPAYTLVSNPVEYLSNYDLVLFKGEPKQLPITIYPLNGKTAVEILYDPTMIKFYEDGRIASMQQEQCETVVTISSLDGTVNGYINILLTTPARNIKFDATNNLSIDAGESTLIKYTVEPADTVDTSIDWSADVEGITFEQVDATSVLVHTTQPAIATITAKAHDGYGAQNSFKLEVVRSAESIVWPDDPAIIYHETDYFTGPEAIAYNNIHRVEINDGILEEVAEGDVEVPEYYSMTVLLHKEYELAPIVSPADTTYPQLMWTTSNLAIGEVLPRKVNVITKPAVTHIVTQEDVDNGLTDVNGNVVTLEDIDREIILENEISEEVEKYFIRTYQTGNVIFTGRVARYADDDNLKVEIHVTVNQSVETINLNLSSISMNVNTRKKLTAEVLPEAVANAPILWYSENEDVATVSPTGTVTAIAVGATNIFVAAQDGSEVNNHCAVTVTIPAKDIILNADAVNGIVNVGIGKTAKITSEIIYSDGTTGQDASAINWSSTNESVATIAEDGTVTGVQVGYTTIVANAKDGSGVLGSIQVQVVVLAQSIEFVGLATPAEITMDETDSLVLVPKFVPSATNEVVNWSSSDETVAKVKESGIVYALKEGEATITAKATDGTDVEASCKVTILKNN